MLRNISVREVTQFLFGLMLVFGALTLVPKALMLLKARSFQRGILYFCLGGLSLFLAILAFAMAFD